MSLEQWYRHGRGQYSLPVSQTFVIAARAAYERCWISSKIPRDPCRNGDIWQCRRTKAPRNFPRPIRFNAIETQRNFGRTELVAGSSPTPRSYWSGNNKIGGLSSSRFESESKIVRASRAMPNEGKILMHGGRFKCQNEYSNAWESKNQGGNVTMMVGGKYFKEAIIVYSFDEFSS